MAAAPTDSTDRREPTVPMLPGRPPVSSFLSMDSKQGTLELCAPSCFMLTPVVVSGRRTEAIRETAGRGMNAATNGSRSTMERCPSTATQV